jgi:hypothetical protein
LTNQTAPSERARSLKERTFLEFKRFMAIFFYLWVVFALLSIHKTIVLARNHINYQEHTLAVINAFVLAKVLLIGEHFRLGSRFKGKPLIYPVLYKCLSFSVLLIGAHIIEKIFVGMIGGKTVSEAFSEIGGGTLISIMSMSTLAFVMLIPFFAFREFGRIIGQQELRSLFLGRGGKLDVGTFRSTGQSTEEGNILAK